ncbi:MFS transporter [Prescottella subtropica]|uniref:MFS transporter n=1 Tax=Prescottella subtropica TaxID=2545757 RepID=UPI0010F6760C|nr:MFS transporter [Prescottella subtropica]
MSSPASSSPSPASVDTEPDRPTPPFGHLYRHAGALIFPIGILARLPFAMLTLGISSYVAIVRDSYTEGGLAAGAYAIGAAIGGILAGTCADRFGQRIVIPILAVANSIFIAATLFAADGPLPLLIAAAALCGLTIVPVGPFARVRWSALVRTEVDPPQRSRVQGAAFGYETLADEMTFVFGPALVGILARYWAGTPLVACTAIVLVFGLLFARHRTVDLVTRTAAAATAASAPLRAFLRPDRVTLVAIMVAIGTLFGALMNSVVAFAGEHGDIADAGLIYAGFGIGSGVASIAVGLASGRVSLHVRLIAAAAWSVAACAVLPLVTSGPLLSVVLAVLGLGIGPVIVTVYEIATTHTPDGRGTLHMALLSSALISGNAIGAPLAGALAEAGGAASALRAVLAASVVLAALTVLARVTARVSR